MKEVRKGELKLQLHPTSSEMSEISNLFTELGISKQRQSEVFITDIIDGLKKRIGSKPAYTQTNQQLNEKDIKVDILNKVKDFIIAKPKTFKQVFNYFFIQYSQQLGSHRTRLSWMKQLFEMEEFLLLNIKPYFEDYLVIHKNSFWHAQFKDHCFLLPVNKLDYQPTSTNAAKKKLYNYLNFNHMSCSLDKVEDFCVKCLKAFIDESEKPMYPEPIFSEVVELRSNWKHKEAKALLKKEKEYKGAQKLQIETSVGLQFLASFNVAEEEEE